MSLPTNISADRYVGTAIGVLIPTDCYALLVHLLIIYKYFVSKQKTYACLL